MNFQDQPFIVIWETTQACDLVCHHCRACAQPSRSPFELTTEEAELLIDQVAELAAPVFVLTGGDPLKRPDIYHLVEYGRQAGVRTSMTPSATPLLTREALSALERCGLARLAVSLDGSKAAIHDDFRGVPGSYNLTLEAVRWANKIGLPVQINTTITRRNLGDIDSIVALLQQHRIVLWSVFFLVPTGRAQTDDLISAAEFEQVFEKLEAVSHEVEFDIKTTEAQHFRRFLAQRRAERRRSGAPQFQDGPRLVADTLGRAPRGINDGKGFVFVSHEGEVFPSGFLPVSAGNVRNRPLAEIYRQAPFFRALRDSSNLKGKCGICEFREICGGSRSRAYALTGDPFAEEPSCIYQPQALRPAV